MCVSSLTEWLMPHMKTERRGSEARYSLRLGCFTLNRLVLVVLRPSITALICSNKTIVSQLQLQAFFKGVVMDGRKGAEAPQIFGTIKTSALSTIAKLRFSSVVLDSVLRPQRLACHHWRCPCISVFPEATRKASWVPLKDAMSAQKSFNGPKRRQGSCWEELKKIAFDWNIFYPSAPLIFDCMWPLLLLLIMLLQFFKEISNAKFYKPRRTMPHFLRNG